MLEEPVALASASSPREDAELHDSVVQAALPIPHVLKVAALPEFLGEERDAPVQPTANSAVVGPAEVHDPHARPALHFPE